MPSSKTVEAVCTHCRANFLARASAIKRDKGKFCSLSCSISNRNLNSKLSRVDLFWSNVEKGDKDDCWEYRRCLNSGGYGRVPIGKKFISAHRFSWELHNESIPEGLFVCHHCDNPPCVNPNHLFIGTCADNNKDKLSKGRAPTGERHWRSKLTQDEVLDIRRQLDNGKTGYELSKQYAVHHQTIYSIKYKHNWTLITDE